MPLIVADLRLSTTSAGSLLSAFPCGYLLTQVVGGMAADRYGAKSIMNLVLVSTALGMLLIGSLQSFTAIRTAVFLMGFLQGPLFPTNGVLQARWVPRSERASATALMELGNPLGALVAMFFTPILAQSLGWRAAIILLGMATFLFAMVWQALAANCPTECRYIKAMELSEMCCFGLVSASKMTETHKGHSIQVSGHNTSRVFAFPAVWSVLLANIMFNFNRYFSYNWVPLYFTDGLGVSVSQTAHCMLWPNIADMIFALAAGRVADKLANTGRMSTPNTLRMFSAIGFLGTGTGLYLAGQTRDKNLVTALISFASGMQACHTAGFKSSYADISTQYAGIIYGTGNMLASMSSAAVPVIGAAILDACVGSHMTAAWEAVFRTVLGVSAMGVAFYTVMVDTSNIDIHVQCQQGGSDEHPPQYHAADNTQSFTAVSKHTWPLETFKAIWSPLTLSVLGPCFCFSSDSPPRFCLSALAALSKLIQRYQVPVFQPGSHKVCMH